MSSVTKYKKVLIAPDKYKGSLSATEVSQAIAKGLKSEYYEIETIIHPMADGGDGSIDVIAQHMDLYSHIVETTDPIGRKIKAQYYTSKDTAFIEMAKASGLVLLDEEERNPTQTTTIGTGQLLVDAISKGYENIYLFLGGSATNDAGMGIAQALGFRFLDDRQNELAPIGASLSEVSSISYRETVDLSNIGITLLCDVTNPLYGADGAAYVYASQKGASADEIVELDTGLKNINDVIYHWSGKDMNQVPGSGAAGGIAATLVGLCGADIENGFNAIARLTRLDQKISQSDLVISGEGKLDSQSLSGKVIDGVASLCKLNKKPIILVVGHNELKSKNLNGLNILKVCAITDITSDSVDAMNNASHYLEHISSKKNFLD